MSLREWLIIIGALLIIGVVVDGLRRMRRARRDSLEIQRGMGGDGIGQTPIDEGYNAELPNGGGRPVGSRSSQDRAAATPEPEPVTSPESDTAPEQAPAPGRAPDPAPQPDPEPGPEPGTRDSEVPLSASDDDGIVGPARVQGESSVRARAAEAGEVAGEAASRLSAGARDIWQKIREGASRDDPERGDEGDRAQGESDVEQGEAGVSGDVSDTPPTAGANRPEAEEVIVVHAHCRGDERYSGTTIRQILEACGMEYGDLGIYHRHEEADTRTPVQFSVASAVSPGTLTPEEIETLATPGLSFFMSLPGPSEPVQAFDFMLETANTVVRNLGGELRDEHRSVMTSQTIEHCRQRIREFERKRRSPARA